ncbi:MAG: hypothetical protein PF488_04620 [Patescibacteria group bacterium]|jgi:hypothetical protein|nr:hypothetical protein [Patescibacteria group bacterium]
MKHPRSVENYNGTFEELANGIGNMSYDQVAVFLDELAKDFKNQAEADIKRGRPQLAIELFKASFSIEETSLKIKKAWQISKPYM